MRDRRRRERVERRGGRAHVLAGRVRSGQTTLEHLAVAGWLGDQDAAAIVPPWTPPRGTPTGSWPALHALEHAVMEPTVRVRAAALIAARALPTFERWLADDQRPREAVLAALRWTDDPSGENMRAAYAASHGAFDAASVAREPPWGGGMGASNAAGSAANAALAAASSHEEARVNSARAAASCASNITESSRLETRDVERDAEHEAQRRILVAVLAGDPLDEFRPPKVARNPPMRDSRRRERAAARGDEDARFRLFMDRVDRGEVWIDARPLKGDELEDGSPDLEGDHRRMAGRPVLLIGYVAVAGATGVILQKEHAALAVVDTIAPRIAPRESGQQPLWRGDLVSPRPHRLLGDPNAVFFGGPLYDDMESPAHEVVGARPGEEALVARWLESFGWPDRSWFGAALGKAFRLPFKEGDRVRLRVALVAQPAERRSGLLEAPAGVIGRVRLSEAGRDPEVVVRLDESLWGEREPVDLRWRRSRIYDVESELELIQSAVRNPILGPVERRESLEPPSCPACAASWERLRTRRGGFWFMCRRHAEEAQARRRAEAARRRVREIERSGDPGWSFDPDAEG